MSWLVKRQTLDNARAVGLDDRGMIAPGYKADLNVIDFDKLGVEAPVMKWDLPAGGKRLLQKARGYRATIVSGAVTYRDGVLVKRHTLDNAKAVGLDDRGRVAPGWKADLNVIDFDKLRVEAPVMKWDLPAGGKRLLQKARGYRATVVSGAVTYRDGEATGALPGKLVRGPQTA